MSTKEIGPTKIKWPHTWLRGAMVGQTEPAKGIRPPTKKLSPLRRMQKLRRMKAAVGRPRDA
jgi:hypothetical protein